MAMNLAESEFGGALLDAVEIEVAVVDAEGIIRFANAAWTRHIERAGVVPPRMRQAGANLLQGLTEVGEGGEVLASQLEAGLRAVIGGAQRRFELLFQRVVDPEEHWYLLCATPLDDTAPPHPIAITCQDVTRVRQATVGVVSSEYNVVRRAQQDREVSSLETMSMSATTTVTAALFGKQPIREAAVATFGVLVSRYEQLLEQMIDNRIYRGGDEPAADLRELAQQLRFLNAGPRDVLDIHLTAVKVMLRRAVDTRAALILEEARLLALQLMGELLSIYRLEAVAGHGNSSL